MPGEPENHLPLPAPLIRTLPFTSLQIGAQVASLRCPILRWSTSKLSEVHHQTPIKPARSIAKRTPNGNSLFPFFSRSERELRLSFQLGSSDLEPCAFDQATVAQGILAAKMNALPEPDSHYLRAAQGWLELGIHVEANEELERNVSVLQKSATKPGKGSNVRSGFLHRNYGCFL